MKWDRPTAELLKALNDHRTVSGAAKVLATTVVTLGKAIQRHGIVQTWVVGEEAGVQNRQEG